MENSIPANCIIWFTCFSFVDACLRACVYVVGLQKYWISYTEYFNWENGWYRFIYEYSVCVSFELYWFVCECHEITHIGKKLFDFMLNMNLFRQKPHVVCVVVIWYTIWQPYIPQISNILNEASFGILLYFRMPRQNGKGLKRLNWREEKTERMFPILRRYWETHRDNVHLARLSKIFSAINDLRRYRLHYA